MTLPDHAHTTAALVSVPAGFALAQLADARFVGGWSLGSMHLAEVAPGVYRGISMFDGSAAHVDIRPRPDLGLIDFGVGTLESRMPRIFIRVTPGDVLGHGDGACLLTLTALRAAGADPARWSRTCNTHEAEILLIKAQLETAFARDPS
jgi:hypothetical protein